LSPSHPPTRRSRRTTTADRGPESADTSTTRHRPSAVPAGRTRVNGPSRFSHPQRACGALLRPATRVDTHVIPVRTVGPRTRARSLRSSSTVVPGRWTTKGRWARSI
jgi:hypothetical protein